MPEHYEGAGNSFVVFAPEEFASDDEHKRRCVQQNVQDLDGAIFVETAPGGFRMDYFNRDGSRGEMCGNGARVFLRFLVDHGMAMHAERILFRSRSGQHAGRVFTDGRVEVSLPRVRFVEEMDVAGYRGVFVEVGVPHVVLQVQDVSQVDLQHLGRRICFHERFLQGTNVNVFHQEGDGLQVRTYERGVYRETLACGTGATACAWVSCFAESGKKGNGLGDCARTVRMPGGALVVRFEKGLPWLEGPVNRM